MRCPFPRANRAHSDLGAMTESSDSLVVELAEVTGVFWSSSPGWEVPARPYRHVCVTSDGQCSWLVADPDDSEAVGTRQTVAFSTRDDVTRSVVKHAAELADAPLGWLESGRIGCDPAATGVG